jgi:cbb3-type cytochrome oxidase cytochrome c subunit
MAQTDPNDTVYKTRSLSKWFAIGSIVLLVATVWATIEDYNRDWKSYVRQNHKITAALAEKKLAQENASIDQQELTKVEKQISDLRAKNLGSETELQEKVNRRSARYYKDNQIFQNAKAQLDADLYILNFKTKKLSPEVPKLKKKWTEDAARVRKLQETANQADVELNAAREDLRQFLSDRKKMEDGLTALLLERNRLEAVIIKNETNLGNIVRNAPVIDFVSPTVKIQQIVLTHLKDDYNFNKVPRVDRCITCHANADKPGFEDYPQPFTSHPNLKMFLSAESKHPIEKIGCTVCHQGVPQSVDFSGAGHVPKDPQQQAVWEEKYHYHLSHHLPTPMLPTPMVEGQCIQCHAKNVYLPEAHTFNAGMRLIERHGCYNCHKFSGHFEQLAKEKKSGPQLKMISSKVSEDWIRKFIWDPKSYRPSTLMPQFWKNFNNSDPASLARGAVEVDSIAHYLYKKSTPYEPLKIDAKIVGVADRGKSIVSNVGCLSCHASDDFPRTNAKMGEPGWADPRVPMFGPELNQLGSKVSKEWLVSWLINPKHYWDSTAMPSMKLNAQEASDVAAYLLQKRNSRFDQLEAPKANDGVRDAVVFSYLQAQMSDQDAKAKVASMSVPDKKFFLGEKLINANIKLPHRRPEWIYTKIRTPRIWDVGKTTDFEGKTRMPHFGFNHEQANAVTAIVLGYKNKDVDDEAIFKVDGRWEKIIAGQRQMQRMNCVGCHAIENRGGEILAHYASDPSEGPPNLNTEGHKIQTEWLHAFLLNPDVPIRPWVKVRMPNYLMTEKESINYTQYFAAYDKADYPFSVAAYDRPSAEQIKIAEKLVEALACLSCHAELKPGQDPAGAAPHFKNVKARLRGPWIPGWLLNPAGIMPGTRMPQLWPSLDPDDPKSKHAAVPGILGDDADKQIELIRNYLMVYPGDPVLPSPPTHLKGPSNYTVPMAR